MDELVAVRDVSVSLVVGKSKQQGVKKGTSKENKIAFSIEQEMQQILTQSNIAVTPQKPLW